MRKDDEICEIGLRAIIERMKGSKKATNEQLKTYVQIWCNVVKTEEWEKW